jgi:hypothetical protein
MAQRLWRSVRGALELGREEDKSGGKGGEVQQGSSPFYRGRRGVGWRPAGGGAMAVMVRLHGCHYWVRKGTRHRVKEGKRDGHRRFNFSTAREMGGGLARGVVA